MNDLHEQRRAALHARLVRDTLDSLIAFVIGASLLLLINRWTTPSYPWGSCVVAGWAAGLVLQVLGIFWPQAPLGINWQERRITHLLEEERRRMP